MPHLPDDILYMVCTELRHQRDFDTLFNCACSGKKLATMALPNLYRMYHLAPVAYIFTKDPDNQDSDEEILAYHKMDNKVHEERMVDEPRNTMGWANLWRTILLSSLGKTLYPYSQYIRTLNLKHLTTLLKEFQKRAIVGRTDKDFFRGELAQLRSILKQDEPSRGDHPFSRWDLGASLISIEEALTNQVPLLEELTCDYVRVDTLCQWIPRFPRLAELNLSFGAEDIVGTGNIIRTHCPSFKRLSFSDVDHGEDIECEDLANFLYELRPQSLESFEHYCSYHPGPFICGYYHLEHQGPETFKALRSHRQSLIDLKLREFNWHRCPRLSILKDCVNLESFFLAGTGPGRDLIEIGKVLVWLKGCKRLRSLTFKDRIALFLMTPILYEPSIHLTSLEYEAAENYPIEDFKNFCLALANQTSLQSLRIKGKTRDQNELEDDGLMNSLSKLVNLTHLNLSKISDTFFDRHIIQIARSLPKLEVWCTSGYGLTDAIWGEIASLGSLRTLILRAATFFTVDGILDYVEELGYGNKGLSVSVIDPFLNSELRRDQWLIQERIAEMVEGEFEAFDDLIPREPETPRFDYSEE